LPDREVLFTLQHVQPFDPLLLVVCAGFFVDTGVAWVTGSLQVGDQLVSGADNVVHFRLLRQDLIAEGQETGVTLPLH